MTLAPGIAYCLVCDTPYPLDAAECPTCAPWQNEPPSCPFCGCEDTYLMDVYFGAPVWSCVNEACPNVEHERFFDLKDVEGTAKRD